MFTGRKPRACSREFAAILRARARALATSRAWVVFLGTPRLATNAPEIHIRSSWERAPKGGVIVAWCSSTGFVRLRGPWAARRYEWLDLTIREVIENEPATTSLA